MLSSYTIEQYESQLVLDVPTYYTVHHVIIALQVRSTYVSVRSG